MSPQIGLISEGSAKLAHRSQTNVSVGPKTCTVEGGGCESVLMCLIYHASC